MKIHSRFKDYYDHVQRDMGGGDPLVVYHRDHLGGQHGSVQEVPHSRIYVPEFFLTQKKGSSQTLAHQFRALVVLGRLWFIERVTEYDPQKLIMTDGPVVKDWHVTSRPILEIPWSSTPVAYWDPQERPRQVEATSWFARRSYTRFDKYMENPDKYMVPQGRESAPVRQLCCMLGAPVFVSTGHAALVRVPRLAELGFAAIYDARDLYQELTWFIGNVLNPKEDPPSPMTDLQKVESHGFDRRASFRHRKN